MPGDSPLVKSWPFMRWVLSGNPEVASAPKSSVAGVLLLIPRRPAEAELLGLDELLFLSNELDHVDASACGHTSWTPYTRLAHVSPITLIRATRSCN